MMYSTSMQMCCGEAFTDMMALHKHCNDPRGHINVLNPTQTGMWLGGSVHLFVKVIKG